MGGRYYDPELGRFLSADPFIQEPANAQSLNRYSYVLNNPLSYTDPSGFFFSKLFKAIGKAIKAVVSFIKDNIRTIFAIGVMFIPGINAFAAGFISGMIASGGDLKAGIIGSLTAGAFSFVGGEAFAEVFTGFSETAMSAARIVAHGVVGGISNVAQGGDFLPGFLSAGVTGIVGATKLFNKIPTFAGRVVASAVIGGVTAELGGGKFKNGAVTGAFAYTFGRIAEQARKQALELSYSTVVGPTHGSGSEANWIIRWELNSPSEVGGWIVQEMMLDISASGYANFAHYWEAWRVEPGALYANPEYDTWASDPSRYQTGQISWSGSARFYEGLRLPESFVPRSVIYAGSLPATLVDPKLPTTGASAAVNRNFKHQW